MPNQELPPAQDVEEVNAALDEGLKSCHQVVSSYRMLFRQQAPVSNMDPANDAGEPERPSS